VIAVGRTLRAAYRWIAAISIGGSGNARLVWSVR
jgi:hypothetical protein